MVSKKVLQKCWPVAENILSFTSKTSGSSYFRSNPGVGGGGFASKLSNFSTDAAG